MSNNNGIVEHIEEPEIRVTPMNPMASLYRKKVEVMQKISAVSKSGYNEHFKYRYAPAAEIKHVARTAMAEAGLCLSMTLINVEVKDVPTKNGTTQRTFADFAISLCDADTGMVETAHWQGIADDNNDKGVNKAATAALKYFLLDTFLISVDEEDDPDSSQRSTTTSNNNRRQSSPPVVVPKEGHINGIKVIETRYKDEKPFIVVAGSVTFWTRQAFRDAGFDVEQWNKAGKHELDAPITVHWKLDGNKKQGVKVERQA